MKYLRPATPEFSALFKKAGFPGKAAILLSSCFGVGLIPVAQGTFATLAGIPLAFGLAQWSPHAGGVFLVLFIALAIWASHLSATVLRKSDPAEVVIDEMAGILVALYLVPVSFTHFCLGFVLFRVFDILKPYPIRRSERMGGGAGIVLDDLLAGVYANIGVRVITSFLT